MREHTRLRCVCEGAVMIALSAALSYLKLKLWANGGSVDLVMIPLLVYALRWGPGWGIGAGAVFGTLKCVLGGGVAYGWASLLLDYAVAYAAVGLAGVLPGKPLWAGLLAGAARTAVHVLSGVIVWGSWMPDRFLGLPMVNIWVYSLLYNGSYMLGNTFLALAALLALTKVSGLLSPRISPKN